MIGKEFSAISLEDIHSLVTNSVQEGTGLEYKKLLPTGIDEDIREFLADISSFANANGGDLIYGISEKQDADGKRTGLPDKAEGLADINKDQQVLRLENVMRDGIDPRIPGIQIKAVDGLPAGPVIVIRVPKSWSSPHMVKFKNLSRFFSRTSAGKYQLNVQEIRSSILASESLNERIAAFRTNRISKILTKETPVPLEETPKLVIHLLPVRAFSDSETLNLREADADWQKNQIKPPGRPSSSGPPQYNSNGLCISGGNGEKVMAYIQLFRNGAIEIVNSRISRDKLIFGISLEQEVLETKVLQNFQARFECGPPFVISIAVLSAKGLVFYPRQPHPMDYFHFVRPIEENVLLAPDTVIQESEPNVAKRLRLAFDALWQSSGWPGSQGYDESGAWVGAKKWLSGM